MHFGREAVEQATKLGAAHSSTSGFQSLIVGDDVAAQLAGDYLRAQLKEQRAQQRRAGEIDRQPQHAVEVGDEPEGAVSEEQAAERRRAEREARKRAQEEATAYNDELGAAVVKSLSRLRVDERVVKILTAVDLHGCRPLV